MYAAYLIFVQYIYTRFEAWGDNGSASLLANRAASRSKQPVVVSQSSCQSVDAASRGQSRQAKILLKSVPGGFGSPQAVPSVPQERQESTEELARSAQGAPQEQPGAPQELPEEPRGSPTDPQERPRAPQSESKRGPAAFLRANAGFFGICVLVYTGA